MRTTLRRIAAALALACASGLAAAQCGAGRLGALPGGGGQAAQGIILERYAGFFIKERPKFDLLPGSVTTMTLRASASR
jgi:hypothetical protein